MVATYNQMVKDESEERKVLETEISQLAAQIDRLEQRYILEEIDRSLYENMLRSLKRNWPKNGRCSEGRKKWCRTWKNAYNKQ